MTLSKTGTAFVLLSFVVACQTPVAPQAPAPPQATAPTSDTCLLFPVNGEQVGMPSEGQPDYYVKLCGDRFDPPKTEVQVPTESLEE